jgi:hypothetical protein
MTPSAHRLLRPNRMMGRSPQFRYVLVVELRAAQVEVALAWPFGGQAQAVMRWMAQPVTAYQAETSDRAPG